MKIRPKLNNLERLLFLVAGPGLILFAFYSISNFWLRLTLIIAGGVFLIGAIGGT